MKTSFSFAVYFTFVVSVFLFPQKSLAQEAAATVSAEPPEEEIVVTQSINLTLTPISINVEADPGSTTSSTIRIRNNAQETEYLKLGLGTFSANAEGSSPIIRDFDPGEEYQNWVTFSESEIDVRPGEWKSVEVYFSPPDDAALGYYYAILVQRREDATLNVGESKVSGVPAILFLASVRSPLAQRQLDLVKFSTSRKVYEYLPTSFEITIKNLGNIQTMPAGDIFIDSSKNNDISIVPLNPSRGTILPGTQRVYEAKWEDGFPRYETQADELGNLSTKLKWDFSKAHLFRMGKYTATLLFVYDNGERDIPIESTLSFWVIPWRIILVLIVIFSLALLGILMPIVTLWRRSKSRK